MTARGGARSSRSEGAITLASVRSRAEGCARTLRIYTPPGFEPGGDPLPVLLLNDGQNLFARAHAGDAGSWRIDEALDALVSAGRLPPWIVIGIDHRGVDRIGDFSPWPDPRLPFEPRAHRYASFLVDDLVPWIHEHLPAATGPTSRILGGSSLGGLVSLYVAWLHPAVFGGVAAFSPSVMWAGGRLTGVLRAKLPGSHRIWLDAGTNERFDAGTFSLDYGGAVRHFAEHLRRLGYGPEELHVALDPRGTHDEASWGRRFPEAMRWLARHSG